MALTRATYHGESAARARVQQALPWLLAVGPGALLVLALLVVPSGALLYLSFVGFDPLQGVIHSFTLKQYATVFGGRLYLEVMLNTLRTAAIVTVGSLVLGYPVAYFMTRSRSRLAAVCAVLVVAPLFVSVVIRGFGWMVLLARHGVINDLLLRLGILNERRQFLYTDLAVQIGLIHVLSPFMILPIASVLRGIPRALEEAAYNLGADGWRVFRRVILPLSLPGVMAGVILVYSHTIAAFVLPAMLGSIQTKLMATMLYQQVLVVGNIPLGAALAAALVAVTVLLFFLLNRLFGARPW